MSNKAKQLVPMPPTALGAPPMLVLVRDQNGRLMARAGAEVWRAIVAVDNEAGSVTLRFPMNEVAFTTVELELERMKKDEDAGNSVQGFMILQGQREREISELREALEACQPATSAEPATLEDLKAAIDRLKLRVAELSGIVDVEAIADAHAAQVDAELA